MIDEVRACVPDALSAFGRRIALDTGGHDARPVAELRDRAVFDAVIGGFGAPFGPSAERRAVVSLWTQFYLAALVIPAVTAPLCLDCELPVGLEDIRIAFDGRHCPARFLLKTSGRRRRHRETHPRFACLVDGHLHPFIDLCATHAGLPRRVLWGNAAAIFDLSVRELVRSRPVVPAARAEAEALLTHGSTRNLGESPLRHALAGARDDAQPRRRVCCLRFRLAGIAGCGASCPIGRRGAAPC